MIKWQKKRLSDLCHRIGDGLHGTPVYSDNSDIYFINGNNLKGGKIIIDSETKKVNQEELNKNYVELNQNSLLISINGTLGSMAFYNNEKVMLGKSSAYLNFKSSINKFYYYYFQLSNIQKYFYDVATGSTIKNLSLKSLQDFEVPVPEKKEWEGIASVLSALDDKIELNNRINAELEAMAKTIYDYWFVQFDFPDGNGKPYKSSGGKMVYNDVLKREVPEGWEVGILDSYIERIIDYRGRTPKKLNYDWSENPNDIIALSAKHLKDGKLVNLNDANRVIPALYKLWMKEELKEGDILMTSEAPLGEFFYLVGETKYCLSQRLFAIRADESKVKSSYLFFELSKGNGFSQIIGKQSGSTVFGIRQDELRKVFILKPSSFLQEAFDGKIKKIYAAIRNNEYQNQQLSQLRDWLLPMLMNGQVSVADAYQQAAQALSMAAEDAAGYGKKR